MSSTVANGISAIARGSAFVFTCRVTGAAFTLLLQVILARWLGAAELGIYVLAFSWCVLLANFSHVGLAYSTVRVVGHALGNDRPGLIWGYLRRMSQIVIVTSIVFAAVGIVFVMLVKEPAGGERMTYLLAMAIVPLFAYINIRCPIAVAFRWISLAFFWTEVVRPIAICILVAGIWYFSGALNAATVMAVQLAMMLGVAIVLSVNVRQRLSRELPHTKPQYETRNWMRLALPLMIIGMYGNYFPEFMLILIGVQVPSDQVAIFNASYRLALIVTFLLTAVDAVTSPVTARLYAENNTGGTPRFCQQRRRCCRFRSSGTHAVGVIRSRVSRRLHHNDDSRACATRASFCRPCDLTTFGDGAPGSLPRRIRRGPACFGSPRIHTGSDLWHTRRRNGGAAGDARLVDRPASARRDPYWSPPIHIRPVDPCPRLIVAFLSRKPARIVGV
jgi:hypothetical protein